MAKYQTSKKRKNKAAGKTSTSVQGLTELACKASGCIPKKRRGVIGQLEAARICFSHPFMKVLPTWYCAIVVKDRSITRPRVILITLPPPQNGDLWGVGTVYVCTLAYQGDVFLGTRAQAFFRSEARTRDLDDVKCNVNVLPNEL